MKAEENRETKRLREAREAKAPWRKWGPYLSERQWGTVREDYSHNGDAWNYFTHDQARSPPIIGARTALQGFPMIANCSVSRWLCGMGIETGTSRQTPSYPLS